MKVRTPSGRMRDYAAEAKQHPLRRRRERAQRNKARRAAIRLGLAKKGDGTQVDHKDGLPMNTPAKITASNFGHNLRVISAKANESKQ